MDKGKPTTTKVEGFRAEIEIHHEDRTRLRLYRDDDLVLTVKEKRPEDA